jgi:hypothetical protein
LNINTNSNISLKATNASSIQLPTRKVSSKSTSHSPTVVATTTPLTTTTNSTTRGNNISVDESAISPRCRQRRFAVLRFLCELESLLFDEDNIRWGVPRPIHNNNNNMSHNNIMNESSTSSSTTSAKTATTATNHNNSRKRTIIVGSTSVTVGNLLSPTQHQLELLQNASMTIQTFTK